MAMAGVATPGKQTARCNASEGSGKSSDTVDCSTRAESRAWARMRRCTPSEASTCLPDAAALFGTQGLAALHLTKQLADMSTAIQEPMQSALCSLEQTDAELALTLSATSAEFREWEEKAASALSKYKLVAEDVSHAVLPGLQHAASKGKHHTALSLVGIAQGSIDDLKCEGAKVLGDYITLRDRVKYLSQCTELALDCRLMCAGDHCWAETAAARHHLEAALLHLDKSFAAMEPSAEFWEGFFSTGEALATMAKHAQSFRTQLCDLHSTVFPAAYLGFCGALQEFCQEHSVVHD
mmetsp:Transcript_51720/g.160239  ORF Transcript_51720/g.160239 Transcript_51720/m.160239 type:complete len:295 (+) Transcript_51720:69-953(+)